MRLAGIAVIGLAAACLLACGVSDPTYEVRGEVKSLLRDVDQVVIAHEDIPGLMPAMTMNFDLADPALMEGLEPGQTVTFALQHSEGHYRITRIEVAGAAGRSGGGTDAGLDPISVRDEAAPFTLTDQDGNPLSLADLQGQAVVLDFIFTRCPGPCPVLTGILRDVQTALDPAVRERTQFVSISLDPVRDTPTVLREYAKKRSLDLSDWSFLTGDPDVIQTVLDGYGVGTVRTADGQINHLVAIFVIDPEGKIAARYVGLEHTPEDIAGDLARILS